MFQNNTSFSNEILFCSTDEQTIPTNQSSIVSNRNSNDSIENKYNTQETNKVYSFDKQNQENQFNINETRIVELFEKYQHEFKNIKISKINNELQDKQYELQYYLNSGGQAVILGGIKNEFDKLQNKMIPKEVIFRILNKKTFNFEQGLNEKALMRQIKNPRNIIKYLDYIQVPEEFIITVLEKCYQSLKDELIQKQNINFQELLNIMFDLIEGLIEIRLNMIIHSDIKPSNILQTFDGKYVYSDFGVSTRILLGKLPILQGFTQKYMAPEMSFENQSHKKNISQYIDIYSLGLVFQDIFKKVKTENNSQKILLEQFQKITNHYLLQKEPLLRGDSLTIMIKFYELLIDPQYVDFANYFVIRLEKMNDYYLNNITQDLNYQNDVILYCSYLILQFHLLINKKQISFDDIKDIIVNNVVDPPSNSNFYNQIVQEKTNNDIANSLSKIGVYYKQTKQYEESKYFLQLSIIKKKVLGIEDMSLFQTIIHLIDLYLTQNNYLEIKNLLLQINFQLFEINDMSKNSIISDNQQNKLIDIWMKKFNIIIKKSCENNTQFNSLLYSNQNLLDKKKDIIIFEQNQERINKIEIENNSHPKNGYQTKQNSKLIMNQMENSDKIQQIKVSINYELNPNFFSQRKEINFSYCLEDLNNHSQKSKDSTTQYTNKFIQKFNFSDVLLSKIKKQLQDASYELKYFHVKGGEAFIFGGIKNEFDKQQNEIIQKQVIFRIVKTDQNYYQRVLDEIELMRKIKNPRNIIKYLNNIQIPEEFIIIMVLEKCYQSLEDELIQKQNINFQELLNIMFDLIEGLIEIRLNMIIHSDIKPSNILQTFDGKYVYSDFGVSTRILLGKLPILYGFTQKYMAPEISFEKSLKKNTSQQSDIYSLGLVFQDIFKKVKTENNSQKILLEQFQKITKNYLLQKEPLLRGDSLTIMIKFYEVLIGPQYIEFANYFVIRLEKMFDYYINTITQDLNYQNYIILHCSHFILQFYYLINNSCISFDDIKNIQNNLNNNKINLVKSNDIANSLQKIGVYYKQIKQYEESKHFLLLSANMKIELGIQDINLFEIYMHLVDALMNQQDFMPINNLLVQAYNILTNLI